MILLIHGNKSRRLPRGVKMNIGQRTSKNASMLEYRLKKVAISGRKFPLHLSLKTLRYCEACDSLGLEVEFFRVCPYSVRQT